MADLAALYYLPLINAGLIVVNSFLATATLVSLIWFFTTYLPKLETLRHDERSERRAEDQRDRIANRP